MDGAIKELESVFSKGYQGCILVDSSKQESIDEALYSSVLHCSANTELRDLLRRFWSHEELHSKQLESPSEIACSKFYDETCSREDSGRYIVSLPFKVNELPSFGLASSPYLANRTIKQLASDEKDKFPLGAEVLEREIYMDDILSGDHDQESAEQKLCQVREICKVGGFPLRKWLSNNSEIMKTVPNEYQALESNLLFEEESKFAILGMTWRPNLDDFQYIPSVENTPVVWTKRKIASKIAQLFDPLGLLGPVIVTARITMQDLWRLKIDWDTPVTTKEGKDWTQWYTDLPQIEDIKIPRWIGYTTDYESLQLHGFADASLKAYGAALYLRTHDKSGVQSQLIASRAKVAPIKPHSVPRLELLAAHLLANIVHSVLPIFCNCDLEVQLWTDSMDVLHWLNRHPSEWETYIGQRCTKIMDLVPGTIWKHVATQDNPADLISRGVKPSELKSLRLWWDGPVWLKEPQSQWPEPKLEVKLTDEKTMNYQVKIKTPRSEPPEYRSGLFLLLERHSKVSRLFRIAAYVFRFIDRLQGKRHPAVGSALSQSWFKVGHNTSIVVSPAERERARITWVYVIQQKAFPNVFKQIAKGVVKAKHPLVKFYPIVEQGILRIGGRLRHAQLHFEKKHPAILPENSPLSWLLVRDCHYKTLHGGAQLTLATLRLQYWIVRGRQIVKGFINKCIACIRYRQKQHGFQLMGSLPLDRVSPSRAFLHSGVDYAGPYAVSVAPGRGRATYKCYICIFICLVTKAVHLELVVGYDSQAFIAAFRRFVARRGHCKVLRSDQGTTFTGADRELKRMCQASSQFAQKVEVELAEAGTQWLFNPPAAPNFGGIWEAAVKSVKHHIKRVVGETRLSFEEFMTLLCQIEACLNSRPLLTLTDDPSDLRPLTPSHWLIQSDSYLLPEENYLPQKIPAGKRWAMLQQKLQQIWQYWSRDYLQSLQSRGKWATKQRSLREGDVVLVRDEITPPAKWPIALIMRTFPGDDGLVRVVDVRLRQSDERSKYTTLKRPVSKIILLVPNETKP